MSFHFSFGFESISNPFSRSTPLGNSIMARKDYRGCLVSRYERETLMDQIKLDMLDFDIILGMD